MPTSIVFETHSISEDNERGVATGWLPGRLSPRGRTLSTDLGTRRRDDDLAAVFASDLRRAVETAEIAFAAGPVPILLDWRLRECDYGDRNGMPAAELHPHKADFLDTPYPNGESWRQAVERVGGFLTDVPTRWSGKRILVVGHVATRWAFDHLLNNIPLERLAAEDFRWQEGWQYHL